MAKKKTNDLTADASEVVTDEQANDSTASAADQSDRLIDETQAQYDARKKSS